MIRRARHAAVLLAATLATGCAALRGLPPDAPVEGEWSATLGQARQEALAMRFGIADNVLAEFQRRHPGTVEALDANFYRALLKLDPANPTGNVRDALALLDAYLAVSGPIPLRADVTSLRRIATALERTTAAAGASTGSGTTQTADKAREDENQRLREELAKANAELERIKRRLAQPKP